MTESHIATITVQELTKIDKGDSIELIDVREIPEYGSEKDNGFHISSTLTIF